MKVCTWKCGTTANEKAKHYFFEDKFGCFVHVVLILTDDAESYGKEYKTLRKIHNKYMIQKVDVYQKDTWECIFNAMLRLRYGKKE